MRPRAVFGSLLALGALLHLGLLTSSPRSLSPLSWYLGWLLVSALVAALLAAGAHKAHATVVRESLVRGRRSAPPRRVEGLGWFGATALAGLAMHLINLGSTSQSYTQRGMWLLFFIFAVSSARQLRGAPGDTTAPIPDGSNVARGATWLRRAIGFSIVAGGLVMIVLGMRGFNQFEDRFSMAMIGFFIVSGVILSLIGLAIAFMRNRQ
jgi:hypothetical protein